MPRPFLKYCGIHSFSDYTVCLESASDFLGFVFYQKSPRHIKPEAIADWVRRAGQRKKPLVGVFVNPTFDELRVVLQTAPLDIIQLHGEETPTFVTEVQKTFHKRVWKAIHHTPGACGLMAQYEHTVDGFVIDCKVKDAWGGTGVRFDWTYVPDYTEEARRQGVPCFIAGGITPDNIEKLLAFDPMAIDLASGIECEGKKSRRLIQDLERKVGANDETLSRCTRAIR
jgi:phosphoribosylanthranilate isomerase